MLFSCCYHSATARTSDARFHLSSRRLLSDESSLLYSYGPNYPLQRLHCCRIDSYRIFKLSCCGCLCTCSPSLCNPQLGRSYPLLLPALQAQLLSGQGPECRPPLPPQTNRPATTIPPTSLSNKVRSPQRSLCAHL